MPTRLAAPAFGVLGAALLTVAVRASPALWLDEAQSVAFARLPLTEIPHALRQDGAPPLYYLLLHGWIRLFGDGDAAVRSLSAVFAVGFVVVLGIVVDRLAGRRAAVAACVLAATNPFVIRYATETRMYSLVMFEVCLALWSVLLLWRRPGWRAGAAVALSTAALLYTHYWALYLVAAASAVLAVLAVRRPPARPVIAAVAAGVVLWLPWLPSFIYQSKHTGTPWQTAPDILQAFRALFLPRGDDWLGIVLGAGLGALAVAAVVARRRARPFAAVFVIGAGLAFGGSTISSSAFVPRYTAMLAPLLFVVAACGTAVIHSNRWRLLAVTALATVGMVTTVGAVGDDRTRAEQIVSALTARGRDGDLVVFCPDQLGPAVSRLLARSTTPRLRTVTFPDVSRPSRVDWIDYATRYADVDPHAGAAALAATAGGHTIWLVWSDVYPPTQQTCDGLRSALSALRPPHEQVIAQDVHSTDHDALWSYEPTSSPSSSSP